MTGDLETSAITWGGTRLPYAIRRSARRKKTVAVTVDPAGDVGELRPWRHHPAELAHHPGPHAPGRLRRRPRVGALALPRTRPRLLAALGRVMPDYERRREDLRQRGVGLAW